MSSDVAILQNASAMVDSVEELEHLLWFLHDLGGEIIAHDDGTIEVKEAARR